MRTMTKESCTSMSSYFRPHVGFGGGGSVGGYQTILLVYYDENKSHTNHAMLDGVRAMKTVTVVDVGWVTGHDSRAMIPKVQTGLG